MMTLFGFAERRLQYRAAIQKINEAYPDVGPASEAADAIADPFITERERLERQLRFQSRELELARVRLQYFPPNPETSLEDSLGIARLAAEVEQTRLRLQTAATSDEGPLAPPAEHVVPEVRTEVFSPADALQPSQP
jgi:hypothetical protein